MTPPTLQARGITQRFGDLVANDDVHFDVRPGEVHALLGENGAGKSTLMQILAGAIEADSGTLELDGRPYRPKTPNDARSAGVAIVYQEPQLCRHMTIAENILLGAEPTRLSFVDRRAARARARRA